MVCEQELLDRVGGNCAFLSKLVKIFEEDYPNQIRILREAAAKADPEGLRSAGHTMKGVFANLAAPEALRLAAELEAMGKSGDLTRACACVRDLENELVLVIESLNSLV